MKMIVEAEKRELRKPLCDCWHKSESCFCNGKYEAK